MENEINELRNNIQKYQDLYFKHIKESNILNQLRELSHTIHPLIPSHLHSIYPIIMHDLSGLSVKNVSL